MVETVTLDDLDRQVLQALQLDGRASFRLIGQVLGVSENTVARRYRNLCTLGLRTVARTVPARLGHTEWIMRIQVTPDAATSLAQSLARLPETGYVSIGGAQAPRSTAESPHPPPARTTRHCSRACTG